MNCATSSSPSHHRCVYESRCCEWILPAALPGPHPDTARSRGCFALPNRPAPLLSPRLVLQSLEALCANWKNCSLSLHRKGGFIRHRSVVGGEREVFVTLTIPVCLSETDFKIMHDWFGGRNSTHTLRGFFSSTTSKFLIFCYIWLYKSYLVYFALK